MEGSDLADWTLPGYTEVQALGEGGFGRVVLARHDASGLFVAIKYLYARFLSDAAVLGSFRQEARLLAEVRSPHVVRLLDYVERPEGVALVMEAVPGVSLKALLAAERQLEPEAALVVLKGSLLGLAAAHSAGVVHRDYKPDNVLVSARRESRLVDFGLAVLDGQRGLAAGSPAYMAPEQWNGAPGTPATDVYAATCVFYQCVAGHRPFRGYTADELRVQHISAEVPFAQLPEQVRGLVAWGMAKRPNERPPGAALFVAELERTARTAYGEDWEERGWSTLAKRAAALVALSPIGLLATTATAAAPVGAGTAAGTATGSGILGAVAAKVGAALFAIGALVGAGVVIFDDDPEEPAPQVRQVALKAEVTSISEQIADPKLNVDVQYVRVTGHPDASVQKRINAALREPADQRVAAVRSVMEEHKDHPSAQDTSHLDSAATVTAQTPGLISVRYEHALRSALIWHPTWSFTEGVTVDLKSGEVLEPRRVLTRAALNGGLHRALNARIGEDFCGGDPLSGRELTRALRRDAGKNESAVTMAFAERGAEVYLDQLSMSTSTACGRRTVELPYGELNALMRPDMRDRLPASARRAGTTAPPAPQSSAPATSSSGVAPDGAELRVAGGLVLAVPAGWSRQEQGLEDVVVLAGCPNPERYFACPRFLITDNSKSSADQPTYQPGRPYVRSAGGRACNAVGRKDLRQTGTARLVESDSVRVAGRDARFERWEIGCRPPGGGDEEAKLTQRIWFLADEQLVILDEWDVRELPEMLEDASLR